MKTAWDAWLQVGGLICILLIALPLIGYVGGALIRAGCYWVGVRLPSYLRAGLIFLSVSAVSGGAGYLLVYAAASLGAEIGVSAATAVAAQIIFLPIHSLLSMAAYVYFLRTTWRQGLWIWLAQMGIVAAGAMVIGALVGMVKLPVRYQLAIIAGMVFILAVLLRQGWVSLFGPVLFYDLVRIARRGRYILLRIAYALLLLFVLWSTYASFSDRLRGDSIPAQEISKVAATFFFYFLIAQLAVVILLTPVFTASAIAEEKDRKTLEFLLATDLRNREIVLSKLASRYCNLGLLVLTGLPILGLTQFMGGVDPDLVLAGFAVTAVTMASLAGLSILQSVYAKKPRDAIVLTYLGALAYLAISGISNFLRVPIPGFAAIWGFGITLPFDMGTPTVGDAVETLNSGNIVVLYVKLLIALDSHRNFADVLLELLRNYAVFHLTVAFGCTAWAIWKVRAVALLQTYGKPQKAPLRVRWLGRPACGRYPVIWKEVFAEPGIRLAWFGRIVLGILVGISMIPAIWIIIYYVWDLMAGTWRHRGWPPSTGSPMWDFIQELGQAMNIWVRMAGTGVAIILLLAVAVRAATTVTGERDRQTMDSLLTTPLDSTTILFGKLLGSLMSVRWGWLWLALIWGLGLITTGLNVLALPLVVGAWIILAVFVANLGLWFSASCKTSLRASIWTILATLMCFGGHWLAWLCCIPFFFMGGGPGRIFGDIAQFQTFGLTPPVTMAWLAFQGIEFQEMGSREEPWKFMAYSFFGLIFWAAAALGLWTITCARFRAISGRAPIPRRATPPPRLLRRVDKPLHPSSAPPPPVPGTADLETAVRADLGSQGTGIRSTPTPES